MSNDFIKNLMEFNRKERFYVVAAATEGGFALSEDFKNDLNKELPDNHKIGDGETFVAMDYHLDWIYASLILSRNVEGETPIPRVEGGINGTQEDIDLIIAYPDKNRNKTNLIMIEAKGDTSWTNKQARSKAARLKAIFGEDGKIFDHVSPYFFIWSPNETGLDTKCFPKWALKNINSDTSMGDEKYEFRHIVLKNMKKNNLKKVVRCDNHGKASKYGDFWKVELI